MLQRLKTDYPKFESFFLQQTSEAKWGCGYSYWFDVYGERKETDKERDKRLAKAKKQRESQKAQRAKEAKEKEERELKEYKRLKAKFEKD
jgi:hypothetical protein